MKAHCELAGPTCPDSFNLTSDASPPACKLEMGNLGFAGGDATLTVSTVFDVGSAGT